MPARAWSDPIVDTFERTKVMVDGQEPETLRIEVFVVGTGEEAKKGDALRVHYTGWVKGRDAEFDSSYVRGDTITLKSLGSGEVIPGWELGLAGMREGTRARFRIPPAMGYGTFGSPPVIPGDSHLVFDIELVEVL